MKFFPPETPEEATPTYVKKMPWAEKTIGFVTWVLDVLIPGAMMACFAYIMFFPPEDPAAALVALWIGFMFWLPQWLTHHAQLELRQDIKWGPWMKSLTVYYVFVAALAISSMFKKSSAKCE